MKIFFFLLLVLTQSMPVAAADIFSKLMHLASQQVAQGLSDPSVFSADEQLFFSKLPSDRKRTFLGFTKEQRAAALNMTHKHLPKEALMAAVDYDIKTLPPSQQDLYNRLSDKGKRIFFVMNDASSETAASLAEKMPADEALMRGLQEEIAGFIPEQRDFYNRLTSENQILYLALSDGMQENLALDAEAIKDPNKAVLAAQKKDADRLYDDQQNFYDILDPEDRILFLSMTPDARGLAVSLTQGIDPAKAVGYVGAIA